MELLDKVEEHHKKDSIPEFRAGDTVQIHYLIQEGDTERVQIFEGTVICRKGHGLNETVTVRKISLGGIGVERIFPIHSPRLEKIEVTKIGDVRKSKVYYIRDKAGKDARIKSKRNR